MHRTLIRAICISEKEERDVSMRAVPKIKWNTGGVRQNEFGFWKRWRHQPSSVLDIDFLSGNDGKARQRCKTQQRVAKDSCIHSRHLRVNNDRPFHTELIVQSTNVIKNAGCFEGHPETRELERVLWQPDGLLIRYSEEP